MLCNEEVLFVCDYYIVLFEIFRIYFYFFDYTCTNHVSNTVTSVTVKYFTHLTVPVISNIAGLCLGQSAVRMLRNPLLTERIYCKFLKAAPAT
jgi:hypothetical protein